MRSGPKIIIKISKGRENADTIEKEITLSVGQNKDILIEWETLNQEVGDYVANVEVWLDNKKLADERVLFKILPEGALTKNATVISVNALKTIEVGKPAKIEAKVKNAGAGSINAKIMGEVYLNNELVDTVNGENVMISQDQTGTLVEYFKPEQSGIYIIKGYVLYEGKSIKLGDIIITAKDEIKGGEGLSATSISLTGIIIIASVIILILAVFIFRKFK